MLAMVIISIFAPTESILLDFLVFIIKNVDIQ